MNATDLRESLGRTWRRRLAPAVSPLLLGLDAVTGARLHRARPVSATPVVYCVYRARNAATVDRAVAGIPRAQVHLHALDEIAPSLAAVTRSSGAGLRVPLLRALMEAHPAGAGCWVVTLDDDAEFRPGGLSRFVEFAAAGGFDIAQPAHHPSSFHSFLVTRAVPLSTARETSFVEVGPVVAFSPRVQADALPFPDDALMGWGLDVSWTLLRRKGFRLGVIDATPIRHIGAVAAAYSGEAEAEYQRRWLELAGVSSSQELAGNLGRTWRPWQRAPRWVSLSAERNKGQGSRE